MADKLMIVFISLAIVLELIMIGGMVKIGIDQYESNKRHEALIGHYGVSGGVSPKELEEIKLNIVKHNFF